MNLMIFSSLVIVVFIGIATTSEAFSTNNNNSNNKPSGGGAFTVLSNRFTVEIPADISSIRQFDPKLIQPTNNNDDDDSGNTWVAVYRSYNNLPSVLLKDDFLQAMKIATTVQSDINSSYSSSTTTTTSSSEMMDKIETKHNSDYNTNKNNNNNNTSSFVQRQTPVAIAKLSPSTHFPNRWTIDSLRCNLKKEDTDDSCDGRSEHTEAIGICIDELLIYYLKQQSQQNNKNDSSSKKQQQSLYFDKNIRAKATLVSGILLEDRGFEEINSLTPDMATHISNLDLSMEKYANRVVTTAAAKSPGARDRAIQILSLLGRLNRDEEKKKSRLDDESQKNDDDENEDYDPWANMKQFI